MSAKKIKKAVIAAVNLDDPDLGTILVDAKESSIDLTAVIIEGVREEQAAIADLEQAELDAMPFWQFEPCPPLCRRVHKDSQPYFQRYHDGPQRKFVPRLGSLVSDESAKTFGNLPRVVVWNRQQYQDSVPNVHLLVESGKQFVNLALSATEVVDLLANLMACYAEVDRPEFSSTEVITKTCERLGDSVKRSD